MNSDVRFTNFDLLINKLGSFEVMLMDPPWRVKGA